MRKTISNNRGFSLVELLIVVAISAILLGLATISYNIVYNANVEGAANRLEAVFNKARTTSMAKGQEKGKLTLKMADGYMRACIGDDTQGDVICIDTQTINCETTNAGLSDTVPTTDFTGLTETVVFYFNSDGSINKTTSSTYNRFVFTKGNRHCQFYFYPETGKHMTQKFMDQ